MNLKQKPPLSGAFVYFHANASLSHKTGFISSGLAHKGKYPIILLQDALEWIFTVQNGIYISAIISQIK